MKREIIKIDEEKCNGCGLCIPNCHEGALQIIDGKARLISDLMCDGLGACIGHCPEGAMEIEVREAAPYDEIQVMEEMVKKGQNVVTAHMKHLKDHGEFVFLKQAAGYLMENADDINFPVREVIQEVHFYLPGEKDQGDSELHHSHGNGCGSAAPMPGTMTGTRAADIRASSNHGGGCPGSRSMSFAAAEPAGVPMGAAPGQKDDSDRPAGQGGSRLTQWPVQMHLINPHASHFRGSDLLLSADCVAYSAGNFHEDYLNGKSLAIACPKLDANKEVYIRKLVSLIDDAVINTITVMKMEVPCCSGIEQMALMAVESAGRKVPVKSITVGVRGNIISENWI